VLGEDEVAVDAHVEDPDGALHDLGPEAEPLLDRVRQTGGPREVVSDRAVFDDDLGQAAAPSGGGV
jgi:hypothetical protein